MSMKSKLLITGTTSGVGYELMKKYIDHYEIISISRTALPKEFNSVDQYLVDLSDLKKLDEVLKEIYVKHEYIPYVINNAGIMYKKTMENLTFNEINTSLTINAHAPLLIMKKALETMKINNFGRIINLTSGAPFNCVENYGAYSASKGLLNIYTRTIAKEYSKYNIKINLMSPGPCKTKMAPTGTLPATAPIPTVDYLLNLEKEGDTGEFYWLGYKLPLMPDHEGVEWLKGEASERFDYIL